MRFTAIQRALPILLLASEPAVAGLVSKADNADELHLGSCWQGGVAPGPGDTAGFDLYPDSNARSPMTTDLAWGGILVTDDCVYGCRIGSPVDNFTQLTLGAAGIEVQGTTTRNRGVSINTDVLLAADQTWGGVEDSSVGLLGTYRPEGSYLDLGGFTLSLATAVSISGNNPAPYGIRSGSIVVGDGASLRISSGRRPTGTSPDPILTVASSVDIRVESGGVLTPYNTASFTENLDWRAVVVLAGGTFQASGYQGFFPGQPGSSTNNRLGGTIEVVGSGTIELPADIGIGDGETIRHRISAPISGAGNLFLKNESKTLADNLIVLEGDNSSFSGAMVLNANTADGLTSGTVRLVGDDAGSPVPWSIGSGNTLEIEASDVRLGSLAGPGTVRAVGVGASTLEVGGGSFSGTITQDPGAVLHLRKTGSGTFSPSGTPGWNGHTHVEEGTLSLSDALLDDTREVRIATAAVLRLNHGATDSVARLFLGGVEQPAGTYGAVGSGATHESADFEGTGVLEVLGVPEPFATWIDGFPQLVDPTDRLPGADPEDDGRENVLEFGVAGDPVSGARSGGPSADGVDGKLRLVLAVRSGAEFFSTGGELVSAPVDGLVYRIQASRDLVDFLSDEVMEVAGFVPPPEMEPAPDGWEYRAFEPAIPMDAIPLQVMRVAIEEVF